MIVIDDWDEWEQYGEDDPDDDPDSYVVVDEDEERELYGNDFDQPDVDREDWLEGASELHEGVYSREEIAEYLDQLAEGLDLDVSDLYDWYYGYTDAA